YCLGINIGVYRIFFNKFSSRWYFITHEHRKNSIGFATIVNVYLAQCSKFRIHGSVPKLLGVHFSKTFVALYTYISSKGFSYTVAFLVCPGILFFVSFFYKV